MNRLLSSRHAHGLARAWGWGLQLEHPKDHWAAGEDAFSATGFWPAHVHAKPWAWCPALHLTTAFLLSESSHNINSHIGKSKMSTRNAWIVLVLIFGCSDAAKKIPEKGADPEIAPAQRDDEKSKVVANPSTGKPDAAKDDLSTPESIGTKKVKSKPTSGQPKVIPIPEGIWNVYRENELNADVNYLGKLVEIKQGLGKIAKDSQGYYAALVSASGPSEIYTDIWCYIRMDQVKAFAALKPDSFPEITVQGVCKGKTKATDSWMGWKVVLTDCVLIATHEKPNSNSKSDPLEAEEKKFLAGSTVLRGRIVRVEMDMPIRVTIQLPFPHPAKLRAATQWYTEQRELKGNSKALQSQYQSKVKEANEIDVRCGPNTKVRAPYRVVQPSGTKTAEEVAAIRGKSKLPGIPAGTEVLHEGQILDVYIARLSKADNASDKATQDQIPCPEALLIVVVIDNIKRP